jgi:predicted flap endonuclease-1-like 5' DNA nuclease
VQELLADLMHARKELTEKSTELRRVVSERNSLRARLVLAERTTRELSSAFRAEAQLRTEFVDTHAASSASLRARVSELEAALAAAKSEATLSEPGGLRRIRGIGPAFERALLGQGITTVAQIAALSADDIAHLAPRIKARADRIERDDWVGQAQQLLAAAPK